MNIKRFAVVSLLATGLGLAACSTNSHPGSAANTPTKVSPADALTNALATLRTTGYDATLTLPTQGATSRTSVDYANTAATQAISIGIGNRSWNEAFTQIGSDLWLKADFGPGNQNLNIDKTKWYKLDASKLTPEETPFDVSGGERPRATRPLAWPLGIGAVFASATNVTRTDATHLAGLVDLTKATGPGAPGKSSVTDAAVPFTATLDGHGRLTELKITGTAEVFNLDITFSNYGSPTPIAAPAADVLPAPEGLYQALNETSG